MTARGPIEVHARPETIAASVAEENGQLVLTVRNDGVVQRRARPGHGIGLRLVALEAIARGGRVDAGPVKPDGWEVRFAVPLDREGT